VVQEEIREWIVTETRKRTRLDRFLREKNTDLTRSRLAHLIDEENVFVNGKPGDKSYFVKVDDRVTLKIPPPESTEIIPENIPLDVLYEDADIIVVNKPAGMLVHPVLHVYRGTLVNALLAHSKDFGGMGGHVRPGIVHRLDRDTSGIVVVAKHERAQASLMKQFQQRKVKKTYLALVYGVPKEKEGVLELPIGRSLRDRQKMATFEPGTDRGKPRIREARTRYLVKTAGAEFALLEVYPETGRTHQIRVHLAGMEHPIVGDSVYTRRKPPEWAPRQMLHAHRIELKHPGNGEWKVFEAPIPSDFEDALRNAQLL